MYSGRDENYIKESIDKILEYKCGNYDFTSINNKQKKINKYSGVKDLIASLNEEINIDFVKESEIIEEEGSAKNNKLLNLLKQPDTKIIKLLPMDAIDGLHGLSGEALKEKQREICYNTKIIAVNARINGGVERRLQYCGHLFALKNLLNEARKVRKNYLLHHKSIPLEHSTIMEANLNIFERTEKVNLIGVGSYRSAYSSGFTFVEGADWRPVSNSRVSDSMDALLDWYNYKSINLHPIERAAIFHTEFIRIHPFVDGNGRTARLLTNYEMVKNGFPTITIKAKDRDKYCNAINRGIMEKDVSELVELMSNSMEKNEDYYIEILKSMKGFDKERQK